MKKKLLNFAFVIATCANAVVFYSFTNETNACGDGGAILTGSVRVSLPSGFPGGTSQTCNISGYNYFHWAEMQNYQHWFVRIRVVYGSGSTVLNNNKYGYLHSSYTAIFEYPSGSCAPTGNFVTGTCPDFPIKLKEGVQNTIYLNLVSPVGADGLRRQANFTKTVTNSSSGFIHILRQGWEQTQYTTTTSIANPCP